MSHGEAIIRNLRGSLNKMRWLYRQAFFVNSKKETRKEEPIG